MTKISSRLTLFYKRVLPVLFMSVVAVAFAYSWIGGRGVETSPYVIGLVVLIAALAMKKLLWDFVDEVYDGGDSLLVKNKGVEERIQLRDVAEISASAMMNPPRVSLKLLKAGKFGSEIVFMPSVPFTVNPFARNEVAEDLIRRFRTVKSQRAI